ncbi:MAG TPA: hypothetical protein PK529_08890 [Verrucomicrobiales bacterium]|nr:hypothetical protein [Opitutaceae bacterium]HQW29287.1 hypothetical protein [Verrucomicrobiales bacterium]
MRNKLIAEFFGTFWLTFGGCGKCLGSVSVWAAHIVGATLAGAVFPLMAGSTKDR